MLVVFSPRMLHLGSIRGTSIDIDISFLILIAFFVISAYRPEEGWPYALLWALVIFISVLIHELAHAGMIGLLGHGSSHVVLGGMGGVTINDRRNAKAWHDMLISVAGPLASFALFWITLRIEAGVPSAQKDPMLHALLPRLEWANLAWGIFNLLPVAPLDGGSVLRNFLRLFMADRIAFVISVWIGMLTALGAIVFFFRTGLFFAAILMAWFLVRNWQQWAYYRIHGYPGD